MMDAAAARPRGGWYHGWNVVAACILAMVVVGGATRLTQSGLSITEWKPVMGVLPPLGDAAWAAEFDRYKRIPQYALLNPDMTLSGFKSIFYWEWAHRLLGRVVGSLVLLPLAFFWLTGRLTPALKPRLVGLFLRKCPSISWRSTSSRRRWPTCGRSGWPKGCAACRRPGRARRSAGSAGPRPPWCGS